MGVPGLYRWLVDRYPHTLCSVAEDASPFSKGPRMDTTKPNPNGVEFDNLYIDMNGVIHPCFHPEGGLPAPQSYDDVFKSIFRYIERVFSIVRPRKLLFLAVDGVAPRAKMNHQRIRRFRNARESAGEVPAVEVEGDKKLDPNVITPGTEFMALLSSALKYYVHGRMNVDPAWRRIKVILSDSSVVGEGEDKIMSYIRCQRNLPGYDPNTRHCLHGLDADLIMLALATHEIHVSILREVIINGQIGIGRYLKNSLAGNKKQFYPGTMRRFLHDLNFEFFNIWVLREYLERELLPNVEGTDFERLIDDFVFMCLFVGNDFLPRLPSLDISEGAIELLLIIYQEEFVKMGYLTNSSEVNLKSMEHFLQALSSHENAIFMKRCQVLTEKRKKKKRKRGSQDSPSYDDQTGIVELQSITASKLDDVNSTTTKVKIPKQYTKRGYYTRNFDCGSNDIERIKRDAVIKYTEGVCWVMHYYYQGVCSWQWFYPYHYAPFASDFCGLDKLEVHFTLGQPFKPLDQLLAVMPAASAQALPLFYRELMTKASSPILDFYPKDAKVDKNGKKHAWQGVCKLPFIEESRLISETLKVEHTLTDEEKQRNRLGRDRLFVHNWHSLAKVINDHPSHHPSSELQIKIKPELSGGMNGHLCISDQPVCPRTIHSPVDGKLTVKRNEVKSVDLKYPSHAHITNLPHGIIMPPRILRSQDSPRPPVLWHATPGLSQSIFSESPTKNIQKKKRKQENSCIDESLGHATEPKMQDRCVDKTFALAVELGMGHEQHESKDGVSGNYTNNEARYGKQNIINGKLVGKSDAELHLVEGSETICEASRNGFNGDEHGISNESQRDKHVKGDSLLDYRTKSDSDEKLTDQINNVICEKPTKREHEALGRENEVEIGGGPKRKQEKKRVRGHKPEAEVHLVEGKDEVSGAGQNSIKVEVSEKPSAEEHEVKGEKTCGAIQNIVKVEVGEKPTNGMGSFVGGETQLDRGKHTKRRVKGDKLGGEVQLVKGIFKIIGPGQSSVDVPRNKREPGLLDAKEQEIIGGELHLVEGVHGDSRSINAEVGEKPTNKMEYDLSHENLGKDIPLVEGHGMCQNVNVEGGEILTNKIDCDLVPVQMKEIKGGENDDKHKRKKQKKREHMFGAESYLNEQKVETSGLEHNSNVFEVSGEATNKMEPDLRLAKEQEVDGGKEPYTPSRDKQQMNHMLRADIREVDQNNIGFGSSEKAKKKLEPDLSFGKEQEIVDGENDHFTPRRDKQKKKKRKHVKADMMGAEIGSVEVNGASQSSNVNASEKPIKRLESDLPLFREQENMGGEDEATNERKRKKHKSKRVKDEMLGAELHLIEKKVEMVGASQSSNNVQVSDLLIPREQDTVGGENKEGSIGEPKCKKQRKRTPVKGDVLGVGTEVEEIK